MTTAIEKLKKKADEGFDAARTAIHAKVGESRTLCPVTSPYYQDLGHRARLLLIELDRVEEEVGTFLAIKTAPPKEDKQGTLPVDEPAGDKQFGDGRVEIPGDAHSDAVEAEFTEGPASRRMSEQIDDNDLAVAKAEVERVIGYMPTNGNVVFNSKGFSLQDRERPVNLSIGELIDRISSLPDAVGPKAFTNAVLGK